MYKVIILYFTLCFKITYKTKNKLLEYIDTITPS